MKKILLSQGRKALIDDDDFDFLSQWKWLFLTGRDKKTGYAARHKDDSRTGWLLMHRVITKAPKGKFVDHINQDKLDNRKSNLRICTNAQNMMNRGLQSNSSSGFRGVSWNKQHNGWKAYIKRKERQIYIGLYRTKEEAAKAYNQKAKEMFGEFYYAKTPTSYPHSSLRYRISKRRKHRGS